MSTSIQDGNVITVQAAGTVVVDQVLQIADIIGIAQNNALVGEDVELAVMGVFGNIPRTNIAIAQGEAVYWNGTAVTASTADKFLGHSMKAYVAATTPIEVRLAQDAIQA